MGGVYSRSSWWSDNLSVEKGVFSSRTGLCSRCLEMRLSLARGFARFRTVRGWPRRQKMVRKNVSRMLSSNGPGEPLMGSAHNFFPTK